MSRLIKWRVPKIGPAEDEVDLGPKHCSHDDACAASSVAAVPYFAMIPVNTSCAGRVDACHKA